MGLLSKLKSALALTEVTPPTYQAAFIYRCQNCLGKFEVPTRDQYPRRGEGYTLAGHRGYESMSHTCSLASGVLGLGKFVGVNLQAPITKSHSTDTSAS